MNALIKVIITAIIGLFGPLEEDRQVNFEAENKSRSEILKPEPHAIIFCSFNELSCKKLNNNISA